MKIFVTGSTGYIGFQVAQAASRAGHEVYGLVRHPEKQHLLERNEIRPVKGTLQHPDEWASAAADCAVIIHAAVDYQDDSAKLDTGILQMVSKLPKKGPQKRTFIYTSGVWVYGNTGDRRVDEHSPLSPAKAVAWRPAVEERVLAESAVRPIVIRPGCVYGKNGGLTGAWFSGALKDKVVRGWGKGTERWAMVHVDDLADAYLRAAESTLSGEVFNIVDRSRNDQRQNLGAAAAAAGVPGAVEFAAPSSAPEQMRAFAEALSLDQNVDSSKAERLLGWRPLHHGFAEHAGLYLAAFKALNG